MYLSFRFRYLHAVYVCGNSVLYAHMCVCVSYMYILQEDAAPTFFQKKQEKIQKQIKKLEAEAVADKDWALKGEVDITCIYNV